ncbi:hypothetical protein ACM78Z_14585 [Pseudomonas aeruginosa]|uniref:hypothetical protein n=1 Tax=Pseudomonas paraeruginosa TaxID=2994495 RepID=UPI0039FBBB78
MNIEVTGSNNKVAGRDFIENSLNLGSEEIRMLGAILAKEINSLPKDGQPHAISVTVGGDQAGNISLGGTQINIQAVSTSPARVRTFDDYNAGELRERLRHYRKEWRSGLIGCWLNTPAVLMLLVLFGLVAFLAYLWSKGYGFLAMNVEAIWIPVLVIGVLLGGLGLWMDRVRRVEHLHMENAQEMIDQIQAALRKKRR